MRPVPASPEQERGLWVDLARAGPFVAGRHRMAVPQVVMDPNTGKQRLGMIVRAAQASQLHPRSGCGEGASACPFALWEVFTKRQILRSLLQPVKWNFLGIGV